LHGTLAAIKVDLACPSLSPTAVAAAERFESLSFKSMMQILALETSGFTGSVAVLDGDRLLAERSLSAGQRSARFLAPAIEGALGEAGWKPEQLELIAVTTGPGSFTGLRVGVTTAKVMAYALGCHVLGVNTLEAIALAMPRHDQKFWVVMDAQRRECYVARFFRDATGDPQLEAPLEIVEDTVLLAELPAGCVLTGPGLEKLAPHLPAESCAEVALWMPHARAVGQLAFAQFKSGRRDDAFRLVPNYFRRTAAEDAWQRKHGPAPDVASKS